MSDANLPPSNPPAGFYPDATGTMRWWDGQGWTEHVSGAASAADPTTTMSMPRAAKDHDENASKGALGWIRTHKGISAVAAFVLAFILIGSCSPDETSTDTGSPAAAEEPATDEPAEDKKAVVEEVVEEEPAGPSLPKKQSEFIAIVEKAAEKADGANEFGVVNARKQRGNQICSLMPALKASNWVGEVEEVSTELGGDNGVLMVRLTDDIAAGTWNNSMSDFDANSMITPSSALYDKLGSLNEGDKVTFSGRFIRGEDCLEEQSLMDENGVLTPDFTFKFTKLK